MRLYSIRTPSAAAAMRHVSLNGLSLLTGVLLEQSLVVFDQLDALTNPPHHRHSHRIAQSLVPLGIRRMLGTTPRHIRPSVREALQPLALDRRESSHRKSVIPTSEKRLLLRCRERRAHVTLHQSTLAATFLPRADYASAWGIDETRGIGIMSRQRRRHVTADGHVRSTVRSAPSWCSSASCKGLPLFPARRIIPAQALALKKYRRGTSPVSSVDDSEHTPASSEPKARPPSADNTPGTFSQTTHSGPIS